MGTQGKKSYAQVTALEKASAIGHALLIPGVILWSICTWYFYAQTRAKRLPRLINDACLYHIGKLEISKLQYMLGTTDQVYRAWANKNRVPVVEEDLGEDAKLYWLGPKRAKRVVLYLHGGAFLVPMMPPALSFWNHLQNQLTKEGHHDIAIAILRYSLVPDATFPTQLKQAILALRHLLNTVDISPQNILLAGDSAGGNLILQLLSHFLHPLDDVPIVKLSAPLRGACLISPWVQMDGTHKFPSFKNEHDIVKGTVGAYWGQVVLEGIAEKYTPYVQALKAPDTWFQGIDNVVDRLLITTGDIDCLRDTIIEFKPKIEASHPDVQFIVQKDGVHNGPFFDFVTGNPDLCSTTLNILEWCASGYD